MDVFVTRPAVFLDYADNTHAILPLKLRCDGGNRFAPMWTKFITLNDGRLYEFVRESHTKARTGIYKPVIEEVISEPINNLTINDLLVEIDGLEATIIANERFIEHLGKKISMLENNSNNFNEILNRELKLFYEEHEK